VKNSIVVLLALCCVAADWRQAAEGWRYEFPRDHGAHREFRTEWWYFTGNLQDETGRRFGYQLTFFRHGIRPPGEQREELSRFVVNDLKFAHFTITDAAGKQFHFDHKISRGAFGEAGFDDGERLAWIDDWQLELNSDGTFQLQASSTRAAIQLHLVSAKPPVIQGQNGVSRKGPGEGQASHYYSLTRLTSRGEVRLGDRTFAVQGESWFDHEWATNQLGQGQIGWDWLSAQLSDGTDLMLYQIRLENGGIEQQSHGTFVAADGASQHLPGSSYTMTPIEWWKSPSTPARYPVAWKIDVPDQQLQLTVRAIIPNQELALPVITYWEGAVELTGTRNGQPITGRGYLELTGYAGPLRELSR
jgi:predicted secreted hydrolase